MRFNVEGISVEVDGVEADDLPDSFDIEEMWDMTNDDATVEDMTGYVLAKDWVESERCSKFWDAWTERTAL